MNKSVSSPISRPQSAPLAPVPLDEIYEEFEFLGDWEARCDYLIDLGFELPDFPADAQNEQNRVHGCQSLVWMLIDEAEGDTLHVQATSDAMIVRGLIAVLLAIYDGKTPRDVLETDPTDVFSKLELDRYLSPARKNGLAGMVKRIQNDAAERVAAAGEA